MPFSFQGSGGDDKSNAPAAPSSGGAFTFAAAPAPGAGGGGFSFSAPSTGAPAPGLGGGLNFGGNAPAAPATGGSMFGGGTGAPAMPSFGAAAGGAPSSSGDTATSNAAPSAASNSDKAAPPVANFGAPAAPGGMNFGVKPAEDSKTDAAASAPAAFGAGGGFAAAPAGNDGKTPPPVFGGFGGTAKPAEENKTDSTAAAPAATTGLFNVATPAPAAQDTKDAATSTPAPATGGFPFGGAPAATTTPGTPAPPTPGPPAPVNTPGGTPGTTAAAAPTAPSTSTTAATATTPREPAKLQYQHLSVEQILNKFQQELEKDAVIYLEEARRVAEYDAILRDSQTDISKLAEQLQRSMVQQKEIEQTVTGIGNFQQELDNNLEAVEQNVDAVFAAQSHLVPIDADMEREAAYKTAATIQQRLQGLEDSLQATMAQMDAAVGGGLTGDVAKIVQILNEHQNSLAALEDMGRRMEHDLAQVNRVLGQR